MGTARGRLGRMVHYAFLVYKTTRPNTARARLARGSNKIPTFGGKSSTLVPTCTNTLRVSLQQKNKSKHSTCKTSAGCRTRFPLLVGKILHFGRSFFCSSGHTSTPNFIPNRYSGIFSTLVENFPLPKKIIPKSNELEDSAE